MLSASRISAMTALHAPEYSRRAPAVSIAVRTRAGFHLRALNIHRVFCFFNPFTPKLISWKQPLLCSEHVAHFPMSPVTLRPLHGGQTSRNG